MRTEEQHKTEDTANDDNYHELDKVIKEYKDKEGSLITILHQAQKIFGYLPREVQQYIAAKMGIPLPEVYGVVSFYSLFTTLPRGKYTFEVCMGTACYVKGAQHILNKLQDELGIKPGSKTDDGKYSIETTRCKGACSLAPIIGVGKDIHSKVKPERVKDIISSYE